MVELLFKYFNFQPNDNFFQIAVEFDMIEVVKFVDRYSYTQIAVQANCIKIIKLLIKFGFDMNARTMISNQTPLHQAISIEYFDTARILIIHGAELDQKSLSMTVIKEHHELLKLLIEFGASLIARTQFGINSFELTLSRNKIGISKSLLYLTV